jgi:hypothetical protein
MAMGVLVGGGACVGQIARDGQRNGGGDNGTLPGGVGGPGGPGGGGPAGPGSGPGGSGAPGGSSAAPATGQRLTDRQYLNLVTDLFGVDASAEVVSLPLDPEREGFRNAATALLPSDVRIEGYATLATVVTGRIDWARQLAADGVCSEFGDRCQRDFFGKLGRRLFRRPLGDEQQRRFNTLFAAVQKEGEPFPVAAGLVAQAMLQSPEFLYRLERTGKVDDWTVATRLSFLLWNSAPDDRLLDAAERQALSGAGLRAEIDRLLGDGRAKRALRDYVDDWLDADRLLRTSRDTDRFPMWTGALASEMRDEIHRLFDKVVWQDDAALLEVVQQGLLSQRGIMTLTSVGGPGSSIVDRGAFIARHLLCIQIPEPPNNVPELPAAEKGKSERDRLAAHRADPACAACHDQIDPLGLAFETYDAVGGFQSQDELGNPLTGAGSLTVGNQTMPYSNVREFVTAFSKMPGLEPCFVHKALQYALARPLSGADQVAVDALLARYRAQGGRYRALLAALAEGSWIRAEGAFQ